MRDLIDSNKGVLFFCHNMAWRLVICIVDATKSSFGWSQVNLDTHEKEYYHVNSWNGMQSYTSK